MLRCPREQNGSSDLGPCVISELCYPPALVVWFCASQNGDTQSGVAVKREEASLLPPSCFLRQCLYVSLAGLVLKEIYLPFSGSLVLELKPGATTWHFFRQDLVV